MMATQRAIPDVFPLEPEMAGDERGCFFESLKVHVGQCEVFDVAVDIGKSSRAFGQSAGEILSGENKKQRWLAERYAHGLAAPSEAAAFLYKTTDYCAPEHERCLVWNDPKPGISWSNQGKPRLSGKDAQGAVLQTAEVLA